MSNIRNTENPAKQKIEIQEKQRETKRQQALKQKRKQRLESGLRQYLAEFTEDVVKTISKNIYHNTKTKGMIINTENSMLKNYGETHDMYGIWLILKTMNLDTLEKFQQWYESNKDAIEQLKEDTSEKPPVQPQIQEPPVQEPLVQPQIPKIDNPQVQLQNIPQTQPDLPVQKVPQIQIPNKNFSNIEMNQQPQYPAVLINKLNKIDHNDKLTPQQKQVEQTKLINAYNKKLLKSREELAALAVGITPERTYQTQPNLKFADLNELPPERTFMNNLSPEQWNEIKSSSKNSWVGAFDTARDIKFNPKMLDPAYAAWKGRVNGTEVYYQDFNNDGIEDILEYNPDNERIVTYNGYSSKPSKQKLYKEFYASDQGKAIGNAAGRPIYPSTMKQWYEDQLLNTYNTREARRAYNDGLGRINMEGFKVKNKTISEMVKDVFNKQTYEQYLNAIAQKMQIPVSKVKTLLPRQTIVSMLMKSLLITWFGETITGDKDQDTKTFNTICKFLNMKNKTDNGADGPECKAMVYNVLKQNIESGRVHDNLGLQEYINKLWVELVQNLNYSKAIRLFAIAPNQKLNSELQRYKQYAKDKSEQLAARNASRTTLYA